MSLSNEQVITNAKSNWQRNTIFFLVSQTITLLGSSLVQYAIMWHITLSTKSGVMMTIFIVCGFIPTFFLSPIAGVWADRYNRKLLIIVADTLIATATLILAALFFMGYDMIWLLFVISAVRAIGTGIQTPAVGAILPQIVPEDKLTRINGINGSVQATVMLISPMASAVLLTVAELEIIFFIDVITAIMAIFTLTVFLKIPTHAKALQKQTTSYFNDLRYGFIYIKNHKFLKRFFMFFAFMFIFVAPAAFLTPLQVARSFGDDVWRLTALEITFSIGMIIGGIVMAYWGGFKNRIYTMTLASFVFGVCTFALGIVSVFWIYLVFMGLFGLVMPLFNTPASVIIQEKVEGDYLGRVFGVIGMISTSMMPLGMLVFGPLSDIIDIEWILTGTGVLLFLTSFILIGSKELVEAGKPKLKVI